MKTYTIIVPVVATIEYEVEAATEEEAKELLLSGEFSHSYIPNSTWEESTDLNTWEIES